MNEKLLKYFNGDELAASTWKNKYALDDEVTPDDMHKRLAKEFARIDSKYENSMTEEDIYNLFKDFKYIIPAGSIMSSLGTNQITSLSNCTVLTPPSDSYSSIMKTRENMVQLFKRRCGVGVDLSNLRPRNSVVNNSAKTSTGAASFMEGFSNITNEVCQQGRRKKFLN